MGQESDPNQQPSYPATYNTGFQTPYEGVTPSPGVPAPYPVYQAGFAQAPPGFMPPPQGYYPQAGGYQNAAPYPINTPNGSPYPVGIPQPQQAGLPQYYVAPVPVYPPQGGYVLGNEGPQEPLLAQPQQVVFSSVADRLKARVSDMAHHDETRVDANKHASQAWRFFKQRWMAFVCWGLIAMAVSCITYASEDQDVRAILNFVVVICDVGLSTGVVIATNNAFREHPADPFAAAHHMKWQHLYHGFFWFLPSFGLNFFVGLAVIVGLCFCLIPGFWLMISLTFVIPLYIEFKDEGLRFFETFSVSIKAVQQQFCAVFFLLFLEIVFVILGSLCFGVGLLVAYPIAFLMHSFAFRTLFGLSGQRGVDHAMRMC